MKRHLTLTLAAMLLVPSLGATSTVVAGTQTAQAVSSPTPQKEVGKEQPPYEVSTDAASRLIGFTILLPHSIPQNAYLAAIMYVPKGKNLAVSFVNGNKNFYLKIWKGDLAKERQNLKEVKRKNGLAYFGQKEGNPGGKNVLIWEEKAGETYQMSSELPLEELLKIADSMGDAKTATADHQVKIVDTYTSIKMTSEEASAKLGAKISFPTYIPKEFSGSEWEIYYNELREDRDVEFYKFYPTHELDIYVHKSDLETKVKEFPTDWTVEESTIDGKKAYLFHINDGSEWIPDRKMLLWEEEKGVVYQLFSDATVEEMKKIAESIQ